MSLEAKIEELNGLITKLIAVMGSDKQPAPKAPQAAAPTKPTAVPAAAKPEVKQEGATLDTAQKLTTDHVAKCGRDATVALLAEFGVGKASQLKADQVAGFVKKAREQIAAATSKAA